MKKLSVFLLAIFSISALFAQVRTASNVTFEDANMMAYELDLKASPDKVIDLWDDFWDKQHDVDVDREDRNRQREVYLAKNVEVTAISRKKMDIYSKISTTDEANTTVALGIGFGYDVYASNDNYRNAFRSAKNVLENFETYFYQAYYAEQMSEIRDQLDDAKGEVEDLNDDIEKNDRQIERWTEDIKETEENIADAKKETENTRENLNSQQERVNELEIKLRSIEQLSTQW